jgi:hypothetical protein
VSSLLASTISPETGAYTSLTVLPTLGRFDEEVVAERFLRVVRDADHDGVVL